MGVQEQESWQDNTEKMAAFSCQLSVIFHFQYSMQSKLIQASCFTATKQFHPNSSCQPLLAMETDMELREGIQLKVSTHRVIKLRDPKLR